MFFFFFSSRRRHTRFDCDWSSDVCSSDLDAVAGDEEGAGVVRLRLAQRLAEVPGAKLHVAGAQRDARTGVDELVRPPGGGELAGDLQGGPAAAQPQVQGACSANPIGEAAVKSARDEGGRFGGNGGCADPAQDQACVSQVLNRRQVTVTKVTRAMSLPESTP